MSRHLRVTAVIPAYCDGARALATSRELRNQELPTGVELEIIVVDDGSPDNSSELLEEEIGVQLVKLSENQGRSAARNVGAKLSTGSVIVFMDSDCIPVTQSFIAAHLMALEHGAVASTGHVIGRGDGFWDRYQSEASARRERRHTLGLQGAGSSQNLAVLKSAFISVGGFDEAFRRYGFEDRDLLLRLGAIGRVTWSGNAVVRHLDALSLRDICAKMMEAGHSTAPLFRSRYPGEYKALGYDAIDATRHAWLFPIGKLLGPIALHSGLFDSLLRSRWLPYTLGKNVVRFASALSFLYGTTRRAAPNVLA